MSQGSIWKRPRTQFLDPSVGLVLTYYPCSMSIIPIPFIFLFSCLGMIFDYSIDLSLSILPCLTFFL